MLYSEFIEGTGCKDSQKNYEVYRNLEIMYMNSDMSKQEIYEYGMKLVDNSKSEAELEAERQIQNEIADLKEKIAECKEKIMHCKDEISMDERSIEIEYSDESKQYWKRDIKWLKEIIRRERQTISRNRLQIKALKEIIEN